MGPHAGVSGCGEGQQGQEALGGQEALVGLEAPSLQECPQLQPGQGFPGGPVDLVGLLPPWGPGCRHLPWGQWAQEAPGYQLDHLEGAAGPWCSRWFPVALGGRHPRGCPGQRGSPRVGQGPQGQLGLGVLPGPGQ